MDNRDQHMLCNDDLTDLFDGKEFEMHNLGDSEHSLITLISIFKSQTVLEERLKTAQNIITHHLSKISIIIIEDQLLKDLIPGLKDIYVDLMKEIHRVANKDESYSDKIQILQNYLQMCVIVLEILNETFESILKNKQFSLSDVKSLPVNTSEILLATFRHCQESNKLYEGYCNKLTEILTIFKLAHDIHKKLFILLENVTDVSEAIILKDGNYFTRINSFNTVKVLKFLVEIGNVLACINLKTSTNNWKGYVKVVQKFGQILNENCFSIKEPIQSLVDEVLKILKLLKKDHMQNDISPIRVCNFYLKIILKLCELFDSNTQEHWAIIYQLLHTCYGYYPPLLMLKGYKENLISNISSFIFSQVDLLMSKLCFQPCFYKSLENVQAPSRNALIMYAITFKVLSSLLSSHPEIIKFGKMSTIIEVFFTMIEGGYCEFWDVVLGTADKNNSLYDDTVMHLADIICTLDSEEFNEVESILFQSIIAQCPWSSLLAIDIWHMVLRKENPLLCYETICNIIEQSEFCLLDDHFQQPQLTFLENLLQRLFEMLSSDYRTMLLNTYPLYNKLHIWKVFGFSCCPKNELVGIAAEIISVVHKTNSFISTNCTLEDFKILCNGLDTISLIPSYSELDVSHLVLSLFSLWKFVPDLAETESPLCRYFLQKLIAATNNFFSHFSTDKLLLILSNINHLLSSNICIKIAATSLLSILTRSSVNISLEQKLLSTISEIFHTLLIHENPIISQNALDVFLQFSNNHRSNIIRKAMNGHRLERIISNFVNNKVETGSLSSTEYFEMQAKYRYVHRCHANPINVHSKQVSETELNNLVKRIKLDIELFHKLTNRISKTEENLDKIMGILNC